MRSILLLLVMIAAAPAVFFYPYVGVLLYYWLSVFSPGSLSWTSIPWTEVISIITLSGFVFSRERSLPPNNSLVWLLLTFYAWTTLTMYSSAYPAVGWAIWSEFGKVLLMALLAATLANTRARLNFLIWILIVSVAAHAGVAAMSTISGLSVVTGAPGTLLGKTNAMARYLGMTLPLMAFLSIHSARSWVRISLRVSAIVFLIALIGTGSRGGIIAFGAMGLFAVLLSQRKVKVFALGLTSLFILIAVLPEERIDVFTDRMRTIEEMETDKSYQGRTRAWEYAINVSKENPVTGIGFGAFRGYIGDRGVWRDAHSNYFEVLAEHGYVGLAIYLLIAGGTFLQCWRTRKMAIARSDLLWERNLAVFLQLSLVFYLTGGLVISDTYLELYYILVAMSVANFEMVKRKLELSQTSDGAHTVIGA